MRQLNISPVLDIRAIPLLIPAAAWVVGLMLARIDMVSWQTNGVLALCLCVLWVLRWQRLFCLWMLLGLLWGSLWLLHDARQINYSPDWVGQSMGIQAEVLSVRIDTSSTRLRLSHVQGDNGRALRGYIDVYAWGLSSYPKVGQKIYLHAKLHPPHNHQNPGGFDYKSYCFNHHIALIGSVQGTIKIQDARIGMLESLRSKITAALPQDSVSEKAVLKALLLAERDTIPIAIQDAFAATGAAHLLAISGFHMGMVAAWGGMLCWWLLTRREAWIVRFPVRHYAMFAGISFAIAYATLAGWPLPAQRAGLMLIAAWVAWGLRARYQPINILLAALMLILLWDAAAVLSLSLWLSFIATLSLLLFVTSGKRDKQAHLWKYVKLLLAVSMVASLATLPLITAVFERFPLWSLPSNMVLVPLYGFWVLPLALIGEALALIHLPAWATVVMAWAGDGIDMGNHFLLYIHHLPGGNIWLPSVHMVWVICYLIAFALASLLWLKNKAYLAMLLLLFTVVIYAYEVIPERDDKAPTWVVWDVGQGAAATWIQQTAEHKQKVMVIDVPGRKGSRFNGGTTVAAGLRHFGITHVDVLMLSHAQADHAGGSLHLMDSLNHVSELWLADVPANHQYPIMQHIVQRIHALGGRVRWLKQGDDVPFGDARMHVLWPPKAYAPVNDNNTSLVCALESKDGYKVFVSGDMEAPVEKMLLKQGLLSPFDMMLMPHHGSHTSSTLALVKTLQPKVVVAQTGLGNHFGFPKKAIVQRYINIGAKLWDTSQGAVLFDRQNGRDDWHQFHSQTYSKRDVALQWVELLI